MSTCVAAVPVPPWTALDRAHWDRGCLAAGKRAACHAHTLLRQPQTPDRNRWCERGRYLVVSDTVKRDKDNRAQTEAIAAMKIANELFGTSKPLPYRYVHGYQEMAAWRDGVALSTRHIQEAVMKVIESVARDKEKRKRKRKTSGAVIAIVRACGVVKTSMHDSAEQ